VHERNIETTELLHDNPTLCTENTLGIMTHSFKAWKSGFT